MGTGLSDVRNMWLVRRSDGAIHVVGRDGWPVEVDPDTPDLEIVPGWRPAVAGVRHIGGTVNEPPVGVATEMLCGRQVTLPRRPQRSTPVLYDCHACWYVWLGCD
ncbi:hypothetical protein [Prauserella aidingensis]|uniref:hypothetical protein n=1 Tax=Prauserella aidingensis TaxID=387890 RepID=UPI0020A59E25|nr:hypothetical protein [Prauserella aidingensis]